MLDAAAWRRVEHELAAPVADRRRERAVARGDHPRAGHRRGRTHRRRGPGSARPRMTRRGSQQSQDNQNTCTEKTDGGMSMALLFGVSRAEWKGTARPPGILARGSTPPSQPSHPPSRNVVSSLRRDSGSRPFRLGDGAPRLQWRHRVGFAPTSLGRRAQSVTTVSIVMKPSTPNRQRRTAQGKPPGAGAVQ